MNDVSSLRNCSFYENKFSMWQDIYGTLLSSIFCLKIKYFLFGIGLIE
jgi:hypothetical protein